MLLYLLRHGDAIDQPRLHDRDRPLSDRGRGEALAVAHFFQRRQMSIDLIIASPLLRTQQMAGPTKELLAVQTFLISNTLLPGSNHEELFDLLNAHATESVLLVGHEPHLSTAIALLIAGDTTPRVEMKKASLACLDLARPIAKGRASLRWLLTSELLDSV